MSKQQGPTLGKRQLFPTPPAPPVTPTEAVAAANVRARMHPLGPGAEAYRAWQKMMKLRMLQLMEENRAALDACTGEPDCPTSVHYPHCWVAR